MNVEGLEKKWKEKQVIRTCWKDNHDQWYLKNLVLLQLLAGSYVRQYNQQREYMNQS